MEPNETVETDVRTAQTAPSRAEGSRGATTSRPWLRALVTAVGTFVLFVGATRGVALLGADWAAHGATLPVLGPAMAFGIAIVALWGAPMALAAVVGIGLGSATLPVSLAARGVITVMVTLAVLAGGGIMSWVRARATFSRVRDVYALLMAGGIVAPGLVALGILGVAAYGAGPGARAGVAGRVLVESATGIIVAAPALFALLDAWGRRRPTRFDTGKTIRDRLLIVLAVGVLIYGAFGGVLPADLQGVAALLAFPLLAVAATRLTFGTLSVAILVVGAGTMTAAFAGTTFVDAPQVDAVWLGAAYAIGAAVTILLVQAVVHERAGVQASLGAAQEQYKRLLDYAPDLIVSVDRKARVLFTNRSLGTKTPAEARGMSFLGLFEGASATVVRERLGLVFNTANRTTCEVPGKGARGRSTWYACEFGPVRDETGVVAAMVILRDVTDKRIAEERLRDREARLRALFEGSSLGIAVIGRDGRIQETNPAFGRLVGKDDRLIEDEDWLDYVHPEDRPGEEPLLDQLLHGHREGYQLDERFIGKGGRETWVRLTMSLVRDAEDVPLFGVAMAEDIAARLQAEEADRIASDRLREIERLEEVSEWKTQLLNIASHEIKNPLVPIRIQLNLLRKGKYGDLNDKQEKAVGIVERESERLATLVNDVLDMARVQVGRLQVSPEPTEAERLVEGATEAYLAAAEEAGIALVQAGAAGVAVMADEARVRQVLVNLLSNAMKFTPEGGRIEVGAEPEDGMARFHVTDTGPGMNEEQMARLFQPFSQVHDPKSGPAGTGIGLFIARGIIEAHGGTIGCSSPGPGQGSTFWFTLPLA